MRRHPRQGYRLLLPNDWWLDDQLLTSLPPDFYATDAITDYTIDFIDEARSQGKPFMTWVCYNAPHSPLQAPEANVMKYRNAGTYDTGWDQLREKRFERQKAMGIVGEDWVLPRKGVARRPLDAEGQAAGAG